MIPRETKYSSPLVFLWILNVYTMKKFLKTAWLILILITPFVLWLLPSGFFDDTGVVTCPSVALFNFECIGCGMTRAVMHFHHFNFNEALYYNYGVIIIYPFLAIMWVIYFLKGLRYFGIVKKEKLQEA